MIWTREGFPSAGAAFAAAQALVDERQPGLDVLGDFVLPPAGGAPSRDFQTLHFDFGVPLDPVGAHDVARYTALHVPADRAGVEAVTTLVPLAPLLAQRSWPAPAELVARLVAYGDSHGAWAEADGYVEGSLARIVEAVDDRAPALPSVKADPAFLCGTEFASRDAERAFLAARGVPLDGIEVEVALRPGDLLVFDNLAVAHGRRGTRAPGELHQRVFGHRALAPDGQRRLRDVLLGAFTSASPGRPA